jgi:2-oxoglutarate dehydrogenase complex dihydrolipoamide succinyltransferase (E2) component
MPVVVKMPQLGETVAEGTIARWLKRPGEKVRKNEPLLEISSDKVDTDFPSPVDGTLIKILAQEGATVPIGADLAVIALEGEEESGEYPAPPAEEQRTVAGPTVTQVTPTVPQGEAREASAPRYTPVVLRLAQEHGIDLSQVKGSGLGGRVTRKDLEMYIQQREQAAAAPTAPRPAAPEAPAAPAHLEAPAPGTRTTLYGIEEVVPMDRMRKLIAEHMVRSVHTSPHVTTVVEVDMTSIVRFRESFKEEFRQREGVNLTYLPFIILATVSALKRFPIFNASIEGDSIVYKRYINIGIAVALEHGLIVPVIKNADEKSLVKLAREVEDLASRARSGKLTVDDVHGGTFTITNPGVFGTIMGTPIINQPQVAILDVEAVVKRPVVVDDAIAIRHMMNLCLSFDHRAADGMHAAQFLGHIKAQLEGWDSSQWR